MTQLRQRKVSVGRQSQTVELVKLKNRNKDISRNKFMYVVRDKMSKDRLAPPEFTKREGERVFRETIEQIKRGMEASKQDDGGAGLLGGGQTGDMFSDDDDFGGLI